MTGDDGTTVVEYALLIAFIAVACIGAASYMGLSLSGFFSEAAQAIEDI